MRARTDGAHNVASIELTDGKEVERSGEKSDPRRAAHRMQQQVTDTGIGMYDRGDEIKNQRSSENYIRTRIDGEGGNYFGVQDAIEERGQRHDESDERAGGADIEESARGADGRANENECAESADERRARNKEGIRGANVMMTACVEMT